MTLELELIMERLLKKRDGLNHQVRFIHESLTEIYELETLDPKRVSQKALEKKTRSLETYEAR